VNMNSSGASPRAIGKGLQFVTGRFRWRVGYEGDEEIWRWVLGTYARTTVGGETIVFDHAFKEIKSQKSATLEFDDTFPTGKVTRCTGAFCTGISAVISDGQIVVQAEFAAEDVTENTTPMGGTPTVTNLLPVYFHELLRTSGNIADGTGITFDKLVLSDFQLEMGASHNTQRTLLGSVWANSPVRNGPFKARISFEQEWNADTYIAQAAMQTGTPVAIKLIFRRAGGIGVASFYEFEIIASSPTAMKWGKKAGSFDVITQPYGWALAFNAADASCIKIRKRNLAAALA